MNKHEFFCKKKNHPHEDFCKIHAMGCVAGTSSNSPDYLFVRISGDGDAFGRDIAKMGWTFEEVVLGVEEVAETTPKFWQRLEYAFPEKKIARFLKEELEDEDFFFVLSPDPRRDGQFWLMKHRRCPEEFAIPVGIHYQYVLIYKSVIPTQKLKAVGLDGILN